MGLQFFLTYFFLIFEYISFFCCTVKQNKIKKNIIKKKKQKKKYVIIASLMGKLINRIPGSCHLISSLPGSALRMHVESLGKPRDVNKRSQSLAW